MVEKLEVIAAKDLWHAQRMTKWVYDQIHGTTMSIIKFGGSRQLRAFALGFFNEHLVPKYGEPKAGQIPFGSWGPYEHALGRGLAKVASHPDYDSWALIPPEILPDVQEYIAKLAAKGNPEQ
ncbi:hypothetical protein J4234_01905 [Candidatus Woesearchaeota archaeon]|nr:hypothetical protein [Candidatus Woesearchaeota archaeon]